MHGWGVHRGGTPAAAACGGCRLLKLLFGVHKAAVAAVRWWSKVGLLRLLLVEDGKKVDCCLWRRGSSEWRLVGHGLAAGCSQ